ncbi:FadR/GntR family transcriptional regulator [Azospirillum sp. sgz301742]
MPFQAIETQRLYQQVAEQIGALIRRGEFAPGHRLPPERDLARSLGVSRPVLREAMVALEIAGLVEVRTGSGAYVRAPRGDDAPALGDAGPSPFDLIRARLMIEGEIAFAAAEAATPADLESIAGTQTLMERAILDGQDTKPIDRLFHVRIAAATGNTVLVSVVEGLWANMVAPVFDGLSRHTGLPDNQSTTLADHARIVEALRRRDAAAARAAMHEHLAQVEQVLLCGEANG